MIKTTFFIFSLLISGLAFSEQNKFNVRENAFYKGSIRCLDLPTAFDEIVSAVIKDCERYGMEADLLAPSLTAFPCEDDKDLISFYFIYRCFFERTK